MTTAVSPLAFAHNAIRRRRGRPRALGAAERAEAELRYLRGERVDYIASVLGVGRMAIYNAVAHLREE